MSRNSDMALVWQQIKYQNKIFWRTPIAAFFTLVFPLMFLLVFVTIFGNDVIDDLGVTTAQFYAPALAVFGAVSATYTNLAVGTAISRDDGILKRVRGTPLPPWVYMAGRVGSAIWIALLAVLLMMTVGVVFYGVEVYAESVLSAFVAFVIGVACFAALGLFVAALAPTGDTAPAIANATILPLAFVSGIFVSLGPDTPAWLDLVGDVFPLKPFAVAFSDAFNPVEVAERSGVLGHMHWAEFGVMTAWMVGGILLAMRFFTWEPRGGERRGRRRKKDAAEVVAG